MEFEVTFRKLCHGLHRAEEKECGLFCKAVELDIGGLQFTSWPWPWPFLVVTWEKSLDSPNLGFLDCEWGQMSNTKQEDALEAPSNLPGPWHSQAQ